MPERNDMPSTLRRSPKSAQDRWTKTRESAERTYGRGQRANRAAFASLRRTFDKVGDHWERRRGRGASDRQPRGRGTAARRQPRSAGEVDPNASKATLYEQARRLDIPGRSAMSKSGLVAALNRARRRDRAAARKR